MVKLELLKQSDASALLEFELNNKEWFESFIEARDDDFFDDNGIKDHVNFCLAEYKKGLLYPTLIKDENGQILGRANLYNIDRVKNSGSIGYRIGEEFTSQGLATLATKELLEVGKNRYELSSINAVASTDNAASQKVLAKNGFKQVGFKPEFAFVDGEIIDCYEYRCLIQQLTPVT